MLPAFYFCSRAIPLPLNKHLCEGSHSCQGVRITFSCWFPCPPSAPRCWRSISEALKWPCSHLIPYTWKWDHQKERASKSYGDPTGQVRKLCPSVYWWLGEELHMDKEAAMKREEVRLPRTWRHCWRAWASFPSNSTAHFTIVSAKARAFNCLLIVMSKGQRISYH